MDPLILGALGSVGLFAAASAAFTALNKHGKAAVKGAFRGAKQGAAGGLKNSLGQRRAAIKKGQENARKLAEKVKLDKAARAQRAAAKLDKAKAANKAAAAAKGINIPGADGSAGDTPIPDNAGGTSSPSASGSGRFRSAIGAGKNGIKATSNASKNGIYNARVRAARGAAALSTRKGFGWAGAVAERVVPRPRNTAGDTTPVAPSSAGPAGAAPGSTAPVASPRRDEPAAPSTTALSGRPLFSADPQDIGAARRSVPRDPFTPDPYGELMAKNLGPVPDETIQKLRRVIADVLSDINPTDAGELLNVLVSLAAIPLEVSNGIGRLGENLATVRGLDRQVLGPLFAGGEDIAAAADKLRKAAHACRYGPYRAHYDVIFGDAARVKGHAEFFAEEKVLASTGGGDVAVK